MKRLLWYLTVGTKGGVNRARIIHALHERPYNANQLATTLNLDYKTVTHHLKILKKNYIISEEGNGYGKVHFLEENVIHSYDLFLEIWNKLQLTKETKQ